MDIEAEFYAWQDAHQAHGEMRAAVLAAPSFAKDSTALATLVLEVASRNCGAAEFFTFLRPYERQRAYGEALVRQAVWLVGQCAVSEAGVNEIPDLFGACAQLIARARMCGFVGGSGSGGNGRTES